MAYFPLPFKIHIPFLGISTDLLSTYTLFFVGAFIVGVFIARMELRRRRLNVREAERVFALSILGTMIGSKLGFVWEISDRIFIEKSVTLADALFSPGGLVFYGGLIASILILVLYFKANKYSITEYGDAFIPSLALGYAVGRMGCMVSGDGCYGQAAHFHIPFFTGIWGPNALISTASVRVWNTPLMEALLSLGLFFYIWNWARYQSFRRGYFIALFLIFNGSARFLVEFLRLNEPVLNILDTPTIQTHSGIAIPLNYDNAVLSGKGAAYFFLNWHWYGFTRAQVVAVILMIVGWIWMWRGRLWERKPDGESRLRRVIVNN